MFQEEDNEAKGEFHVSYISFSLTIERLLYIVFCIIRYYLEKEFLIKRYIVFLPKFIFFLIHFHNNWFYSKIEITKTRVIIEYNNEELVFKTLWMFVFYQITLQFFKNISFNQWLPNSSKAILELKFINHFEFSNVTHRTICCYLNNLKNVKSNHGWVLVLVKLQAVACNLLNVTLLHECFSVFLNGKNCTKSCKVP